MANIVEVLEGRGDCNSVVKAIKAGGLEAMLGHEEEFTIFAPNDDAFKNLSENQLEVLKDPATSMNLILYHCIEWILTTQELRASDKLRTLDENQVEVKAKKKFIKVNNSTIIEADIEADNGIIHILNNVLIPPAL